MAKYSGLSKEQIYERVQSDAQNRVNDVFSRFLADFDAQFEDKKEEKNFWEKLADSSSFAGSFTYNLAEGFMKGIVSTVQTVNLIGAGLKNDLYDAYKDSDIEFNDALNYAISNATITFAEGVSSSVVSVVANVGRVFEYGFEQAGFDKIAKTFDPENILGDDAMLEQMSDWFTSKKVQSMRLEDENAYKTNTYEENKALVDSRYTPETKAYIEKSVTFQNRINEEVIAPLAEASLGVFGGSKERADELYGGNKGYEAVMGVSQSIGNILAMYGFAKIAKSAGLGTKGASAVAQTYFASSVFGSSFNEAMNNGASISDAYTYATGTAVMETAIENIGGATPSSISGGGVGLLNRLRETGWQGVLKMSLEEGIEEIASVYAGTGLQLYSDDKRTVDIPETGTGEFASEVMFGFLGGFVSSGVIGVGRNYTFNRTVNSTVAELGDELKKSVDVLGKEKALNQFAKKLDEVVYGLNSSEALGYVENKRGATYTTKMTFEQKQEFIKNNSLDKLIVEKDGVFVLSEKAENLNTDTLKNTIGVVVAEEGKYAINPSVYASDLTDEGRVNVVEMEKITPLGQRALTYSQNLNVPVALYNDSKSTDSGFLGNNDVVYINEANLNELNVEETIIQHEMQHVIAKQNPELFNTMKEMTAEFVNVEIDEKGTVSFNYLNENIEKFMKETGFEQQIQVALNDVKDQENAKEIFEEELVAYFVENLIEDTDFVDLISQKKKGFFTKLRDDVAQDKKLKAIAGKSKVARKMLSEFRNTLNYITKETVKETTSIESVVDKQVSDEVKEITEVPKRKAKKDDLTFEEETSISKVFGNDLISSFFSKKNGRYRLKNRRITDRGASKNYLTINGTKYASTKYAVNIQNEVHDYDINNPGYHGYIAPMLINDMTEDQKKTNMILSSTDLNYVIYKPSKKTNALGYAIPKSKANVVYLNVNALQHQEQIAEILLHEHTHEMFKKVLSSSMDYANYFATLLFEPVIDKAGNRTGIKPTAIWKLFNSKLYSVGFLKYLKQYHDEHPKFYENVKTEQQLFDLLYNSNNKGLSDKKIKTINEITAQITGKIFSDSTIYSKILNLKSNENFKMYELYSKIKNDSNINRNTKKYLDIVLDKFEKAFKKYMEKVDKLFPKTEKYTLVELNSFIKDFTDGEYTTKRKLLDAYAKEKANKKRGDASITVDNVIYVASLLGKQVKTAVNNYTALEQEFKSFKNEVEYLLTKPDSLLKLGDYLKHQKTMITGLGLMSRVLLGTYGGKKALVVNEDSLNKALEKSEQLQEDYLKLSDEIISIFNMPTKLEFEMLMIELDDALNIGISEILVDGYMKITPEFMNIIEQLKDFSDRTSDSVKFNDPIFKEIIKLQKVYRNSTIKNILLSIEKSMKNAMETIRSVDRAKESKNNDELDAVDKKIKEIYAVIKDNGNDFAEMQKIMAPQLLDLKHLIEQSNIIGGDMLKSDDYINGDAVIKAEVDVEVTKLKNKMINEYLFDIYEQFALLFNDIDFVQNIYPLQKYKSFGTITKAVKGGFKEKTIAVSFAKILKEFRMTFETSLHKGMSHDAYALKVNTDIMNNITTQIDSAKADGIRMHLETPQHFFRKWATALEGKTDWFKDMFKMYKSATRRREGIYADFNESQRKWNKLHPNALKNSEKKIEVDMKYLVQINEDEVSDIKKQVDKEISVFKEQITDKQKEEKILSETIRNLRQDFLKAKERAKKFIKDSKNYNEYQAKAKNFKTQRSLLIEDRKTLKQEITDLKYDKDQLSFETRLKKGVIDIKEKQEDISKDQVISRGHLVSMYLSAKREIEMHERFEQGDPEIRPTNHIVFGNMFHIFDNARMEKDGYKKTKKNVIPFLIFAESREKLIEYLENEVLNEQDFEAIEYSKSRFDINYENLNEEYKGKHGVDLHKQDLYIPFSTVDSSLVREWKLKQANAYNVGVADGMVMSTTTGANEDLQIENIFAVIGNHTIHTGNYSYERLVTDIQNLLVNKITGTSLEKRLKSGKGNKFGVDNGIIDKIERNFLDVLQYRDATESQLEKQVSRVLRKIQQSIIGLNVGMTAKQFLSMITISLKTDTNFVNILMGTSLSAIHKDKHYKWLLENNRNFYWRAQMKFIPDLSKHMQNDMFGIGLHWINRLEKQIDKVADVAGYLVGRMDSAVIVGSFKAKLVEYRKANKKAKNKLTEDQLLNKANEWLYNEVLLYGVANTDSAYRAPLSNAKGVINQMAGRWQSENMIHVSSMIENRFLGKNKVKGYRRKALNDYFAWLLSGLFSAMVNMIRSELRGYQQPDSQAKEFIVNDFIWGNLVGSIPYLNMFSSMITFDVDSDKFLDIDAGFELNLPLFNEFYNIVEDYSQIKDDRSNATEKIYDIIEEGASMFGIPLKNGKKIAQTFANILAMRGSEQSRDIDRFFSNKTKSEAYYGAIESNNRSEISGYIEDVFESNTVKTEMVKLLMNNPNQIIQIYDVTTFRKMGEDGKYDTYDIPQRTQDKYQSLTQRALLKTVRSYKYRKMDDINKIKTIQRVINYYYNYMKAVILEDYTDIEPNDLNKIEEVVERSINIGLKAIEDAKKRT